MSSRSDAEEPDSKIIVRGARVHNLRNVSLQIPRDKLVVLTGPSGSGKSSLAFDTIYAEGQRRYVESLSVYARQFLEQLSKPDVDFLGGLSPTISIEQKTSSYNPRSTVGTVTEVYDYLRVLFSKISTPYCYQCQKPIESQTPQQIVDSVLSYPEGSKIALLAPIVRDRKGEFQKELTGLQQEGFVRVRIDGETIDLSTDIHLDKNKRHHIEVYVDRLIQKKSDDGILMNRVSDSVELALRLGKGLVLLEVTEPGKKAKEILLSQHFSCSTCNVNYPSPEPRTFSFNSPMGACEECDGLGFIETGLPLDEDAEIQDDEFDVIQERTREVCTECKGARLRKESLHFKVGKWNIFDLSRTSLLELGEVLRDLPLTDRQKSISSRILKDVLERIGFLNHIGVGYLSLHRTAQSLSGGEAQRIRLATQIGSSMVGVIYVLDEPSIGLHPKDHDQLLKTLHRLRDLGNTVLVVEHDRETIEQADWIVDLGPGAGKNGGEVTASGTLKEIRKSSKSLTGKYLTGKLKISIPKVRRRLDPTRVLSLKGVTTNNLKNVSADIPLGLFTCITGVSGSGKSSLVLDTLYPVVRDHLLRKTGKQETTYQSISGLEHLDKVIDIDQSPIGRTPRSNPATYTGIWSMIRQLFSELPESQIRGFKPGRFSFNVRGGRCEQCEGGGQKKIVMHFLPDVYVECEACHGKRFNSETLSITYREKNIAEILQMSVSEGVVFFEAIPGLSERLQLLDRVGLGYIQLGQAANSLSGGEAQRMKLARELVRRATGRTLYILDEPSTGLHFDDIQKLLAILQELVDKGNTVIVIEHNLDIIKVADHVIDLGPDGGIHGGKLIASGTPEDIVRARLSHTGKFLGSYLN